jgi:hypothetical protein
LFDKKQIQTYYSVKSDDYIRVVLKNTLLHPERTTFTFNEKMILDWILHFEALVNGALDSQFLYSEILKPQVICHL